MTLVIEDLPFTNPSNTFFKNVSANHGLFTTLLLACALSRFTNRMFGRMGRASALEELFRGPEDPLVACGGVPDHAQNAAARAERCVGRREASELA